MEDLSAYPWLATRDGTFYLRPQVPEDIQKTFGKKEIWKSLRTKDFKEAVKRWRIRCAEYEALFENHRREQARMNEPPLDELTDQQVKLLEDFHLVQLLEEDENERLRGFDEVDFVDYVGDNAFVEQIAREMNARGQQPGFVRDVFTEITRKLGTHWRLAENSSSWPKVSRAFLRASIRAAEAKRKRNDGDIVDTPKASTGKTVAPIPTTKAPGITLLELFGLWERDHLAEGKSARTAADFRQKIEDFIAFLKHDKATKVTPQNVADYVDHLRHERGLAASTVNAKYLAAIRTMYRSGMAKIKVNEDPTERVKVRVPKAIRERSKGFTDDEAAQILTCALRDPSTLGGMAEHNKLACRWVPWICAYTGARVTEVTQLRREDFTEEYGIQCLRITPEDGSVKNGHYRMVPIHPHLIELGLIDFMRSRSVGPLFYVPNDRKRSRGHTQANSVSGKVSDWVREKAKLTDTRLQPNHAWRHRFKTIARDVDIAPEYMDAIQGHEDGRASSDYGENTMKALYREILKLPRYLNGRTK